MKMMLYRDYKYVYQVYMSYTKKYYNKWGNQSTDDASKACMKGQIHIGLARLEP